MTDDDLTTSQDEVVSDSDSSTKNRDLHGMRGSDKRAISKALRELDDVLPVGPRTEFEDLTAAVENAHSTLAERHPDYDE